MRIGLNLIFLVPGETGGMEVAVRELIPALTAAAPGVEFTAFINREAAQAQTGSHAGPWNDLIPSVALPISARRREQWVLGEQILLPRIAAREGIDLLHSLASTAPAVGRFRRVVTVHDLIYTRYPEAHAGIRNIGMRLLVPLAVRRADRVVAISTSTKRDLVECLGTPQQKVDVVPQGMGSLRRLGAIPEQEVRARYEFGDRPVLLSLSAKRPHKNLPRLLGALARIEPSRRPTLVLPGYPTWHERELRARASELDLVRDVRFLGWLDDLELEALWEVATAFVYPSLYEGFGLPVLEAMARGVPVACSNAASLPEVAGDAALLFDPHDEQAMARAIERLLEDDAEADRLRTAGLARAGTFTWERTAELTLESYARAFGMPRVPPSWTSSREFRGRPAGAHAA